MYIWSVMVIPPASTRKFSSSACREREFFINNLLVRIHLIIEMIL